MTHLNQNEDSLKTPKGKKGSLRIFSAGWKTIGRYSIFAIFCLTILSESACKTTKKVTIDDSKARLEREAREKALADKKKKEEEERLRQEAEEKARKEAEEKERAKRAPYEKLEGYFSKIAATSKPEEANTIIAEAQQMFLSPSSPVLILIYKQGETKDYDKPSDISKYLNFLKDQKKNLNKIDNLEFDSNGKITEVTLIKK